MKSHCRLAPLALALLLPTALAGGEGDPPAAPASKAKATDDAEARWMDLDAEIAGLSSLQGSDGAWLQYGALVRTLFAYSEDDIGGAGGALPDLSGFLFEDVDIFVEAERDGFLVRMSADLDTGGSVLEDAYVRFRLPDDSQITVGSFKPRVVRSGLTDPEHLLFRERTVLGSLFDFWDTGIEYVMGEDPARTTISVVNGSSGSGIDHAWNLRYDFSAYEERLTDAEGARGSPNFLRMMIGAFYRVDDTVRGDADLWGVDLALTLGSWSLHTEYASLGDELVGNAVIIDDQVLTLGADADVWSMTFSQMLGTELEIAGRWQDPDDAMNTQTYGGSLNWYPTDGPIAFTGDATYYDSDGPEGWIFSVGANFGYTRPPAKSGVGR